MRIKIAVLAIVVFAIAGRKTAIFQQRNRLLAPNLQRRCGRTYKCEIQRNLIFLPTYTTFSCGRSQMIAICGDIIRSKLIKMIQKAGFFSVIADEATDVANDEQLSICVRFVDGLPREKFLAFHEYRSGVTGMAIADDILYKLSEWQLQPQLLCGL